MKTFSIYSYKTDRIVFKSDRALKIFYNFISKKNIKIVLKIEGEDSDVEEMFESTQLFNNIEKGKVKLSVMKNDSNKTVYKRENSKRLVTKKYRH